MIREFFGIGGYMREAEGFLSWQHLVFVTFLMAVMAIAAAVFGRRYRNRDDRAKNRVLTMAALWMDGIELVKILIICTVGGNPDGWKANLPLYMCSIQLITLPLAAFSHGRLKEAVVDFVAMFGVLGALLGTYGAGNNYACYPVLSFDNVFSGATHAIAGFASLYILISRMATLKKRNIGAAFGIILGFGALALAANAVLETNYMFLVRGDGTPYEILYALVKGSPVWYPVGVLALFFAYILLFYAVFHVVHKHRR